MQKPKDNRIFIGVTVLSVVTLVAYDWWAASRNKTTASKAITRTAERHLIIPYLWGFVTGHLFWSQRSLEKERK